MKQTKIEILDSLRAFAALSVCLYHFICTTTGYFSNEIALAIFSVGKYGVQSFFVISGFVIPHAMYMAGYKLKNFFSFFLKRIVRLEPPYVFSILLAIVIITLRNKFVAINSNEIIHISGKQIMLHFCYLIPFFKDYNWLNQVYWTLAIEFQYYLFIALIFQILIKSNLFLRIIFYLVITACYFLSNGHFLPCWLPVFLLGILLFLYKVEIISKVEYYTVSVSLLVLCFCVYPFFSVIYIVVPLVAVLYFQDKKIKAMNFLGKFSYSIYLIHPLIGASFINILSHKFTEPYAKLLVVLLGLLITLIGSYIMYRLIEQPSKKISASIKYKQN